jgi:hypothetical protein
MEPVHPPPGYFEPPDVPEDEPPCMCQEEALERDLRETLTEFILDRNLMLSRYAGENALKKTVEAVLRDVPWRQSCERCSEDEE